MSKELRDEVVAEIADELRGFQRGIDAVDQAAAERLGINRTDLRCLDLLAGRRGMTAGDLSEETGLTPGAVTTVLDRMERAGYVNRVRDTADRRRVLVELTPAAHDHAAQLYGYLARLGEDELRRYDLGQLVLLRDFLRRGRQLQLEQAARIRERRT